MIELVREMHDKKYSVLDIEAVNDLARDDPGELVRRSEAYYNGQVAKAASIIAQADGRYRFVLLCGPSASGKTTTAHKLKHRLIDQNIGARVLSMDDFYRGLEHYPKMPNGSPDMESPENLDMELLNTCFSELMEKGEAMFPVFDFAEQKQHRGHHHVSLGAGDILIMEGIHALNPMVLSGIPRENVFRIYVSVRTKFVSGGETILVPKDIRLMRRMVRDSKFRSYPPMHTLRYWQHVVASERVNIDLYRDDVDLKMDNTIDYEVCVWKHILKTVTDGLDMGEYGEYPQMEKVLDGLERFVQTDYRLIPANSLLREFIGEDL